MDSTDILDGTGHWSLNRTLSDSFVSPNHFVSPILPDEYQLSASSPLTTMKFTAWNPLDRAQRSSMPPAWNCPCSKTSLKTEDGPIFGDVSVMNSYVSQGEVTEMDFLGEEVEWISGRAADFFGKSHVVCTRAGLRGL